MQMQLKNWLSYLYWFPPEIFLELKILFIKIDNLPSDQFNVQVENLKKEYVGTEIKGRTIGIIGLGKIGSLVAESCISLGMNVIGYDPVISIDSAWKLPSAIVRASSLEQLVELSDFISLHLPLNSSTKNIFS